VARPRPARVGVVTRSVCCLGLYCTIGYMRLLYGLCYTRDDVMPIHEVK